METIFRKVAVTERLPGKRMDCFVFYKFNKTEYTKCVEFIPEEKSFFDYGNTEEETRVTHWLEEIELPSEEIISKMTYDWVLDMQCDNHFSHGKSFRKGLRKMRDFVFAVRQISACKAKSK